MCLFCVIFVAQWRSPSNEDDDAVMNVGEVSCYSQLLALTCVILEEGASTGLQTAGVKDFLVLDVLIFFEKRFEQELARESIHAEVPRR